MIYTYPTKRPSGQVFTTRGEYLERCILKGNEKKNVREDRTFLCHAIARANEPIRTHWDKQTARPTRYLAPHFPWVTFVFGSGCVTESVDRSNFRPIDPQSIVVELEGSQFEKLVRPYVNMVREFTRNLIADRNHRDMVETIEANYIKECEPRTALLLFVVTVLTRMYRQVATSQKRPLAWRVEDIVKLESGENQLAGEVGREYERYVQPVVAWLIGHSSAAERNILRRIQSSMMTKNEEILNRLHIQILSEFAWLSLTEHSHHYHGWSDLISLLAREDSQIAKESDSTDAHPIGYPPRPLESVNSVIERIQDSYRERTDASWIARTTGHDVDGPDQSSLHTFFNTAADVLIAQERLRKYAIDKAEGFPPPVTAFSTSFDLELGMALAHRMPENESFIVVLPVCCILKKNGDPRDDSRALLLWLGAEIHGGSGLSELLKPKVWRLIDGQQVSPNYAEESRPYLIYLAGTPLITPPSKADLTGIFVELKEKRKSVPRSFDVLFNENEDGYQFSHVEPAVLLNEYDAIQHHGTEMFSADNKSLSDQRLGLPFEFTGYGEGGMPRFWLVMGVQMDDPAFRYKLASRLSPPGTDSRAESGPEGNRVPPPEKAGLVVTSKLGPAARDLLAWFGVDIVTASCTDFQEDLRHYAAHLKFGNHEKELKAHDEDCEIRHD